MSNTEHTYTAHIIPYGQKLPQGFIPINYYATDDQARLTRAMNRGYIEHARRPTAPGAMRRGAAIVNQQQADQYLIDRRREGSAVLVRGRLVRAAQLEYELAEAKKDSARLDWLGNCPECIPYLEDGIWNIPYLNVGEGGFGGGVGAFTGKTIRAAIDTAMEASK